ncbi:AT-hook motif nuclear-localized protein 17 [Sesamum angolense]|uniref:AT-hook motif nuclear-localized protein 17 n=1 Tax=Sesamum angolense TaxID=2727404 RepID=A0AAE1WB62_9LAMI|nr:AT-hook motif nuclear-localized protein 17 [Sesamum angolense]
MFPELHQTHNSKFRHPSLPQPHQPTAAHRLPTSQEADSDHRSPNCRSNVVKDQEAYPFPPPPPAHDGATIEVLRRRRGRPPGSKNKLKPPVIITRDSPQPTMNPYVLELPAGVDRRRIHNSLLPEAQHWPLRNGQFSVSVAGPQGQVVGGIVVGPLLSAGTVYLIAATFNNPSFHRLQQVDYDQDKAAGDGGHSSRKAASGECDAAAAPESDGISMYSYQPSDVIWAPNARQLPPPPLPY